MLTVIRRAYRLQAENEIDLTEWLESLRAGIMLALQRNIHGAAKWGNGVVVRELGLTREPGHEELIQSILALNQIELSLSEERRREIVSLPGNAVCADCRAKGERRGMVFLNHFLTGVFGAARSVDPDWASITFGILVCIKCSGIHRSLGVHLSKVRSLTLDFWNPEHVELMKCVGNERSWAIFEAGYDVRAGQRSCDRPEPDSPHALKESWILAKYGCREFVLTGSGGGEREREDAAGTDGDDEVQNELIRTTLWDAIEQNDALGCLRALAMGALVDDAVEDDTETTSGVLVQSAVQRATQLGHWRVVALLLVWGADAEMGDSQGRNLVHYLATLPTPSISVLLSVLRKNPSLGTTEDASGKTPLQWAEETENGPVATIIRVFKAQHERRSPLEPAISGQDSPNLSADEPDKPNHASRNLTSALSRMLHFSRPFRRKKDRKRE